MCILQSPEEQKFPLWSQDLRSEVERASRSDTMWFTDSAEIGSGECAGEDHISQRSDRILLLLHYFPLKTFHRPDPSLFLQKQTFFLLQGLFSQTVFSSRGLVSYCPSFLELAFARKKSAVDCLVREEKWISCHGTIVLF